MLVNACTKERLHIEVARHPDLVHRVALLGPAVWNPVRFKHRSADAMAGVHVGLKIMGRHGLETDSPRQVNRLKLHEFESDLRLKGKQVLRIVLLHYGIDVHRDPKAGERQYNHQVLLRVAAPAIQDAAKKHPRPNGPERRGKDACCA